MRSPVTVTGSSPRMRGAQGGGVDHVVGSGIIPADAGSTLASTSVSPVSRDHPRGCGEHGQAEVETGRRAGSSPRMRGAHERNLLTIYDRRIIPADAGST